MKPVAVLKFGGTSVANPDLRKKVCKHIEFYTKKNFSVVVVVSAMGRKGSPYATDTLIDLLPDSSKTGIIKDFICTCGENISAAVLSAEILMTGIEAVPLTGGQAGIITDAVYTEANIIRIQPDLVQKHLSKNRVVIISGFQGQTMPEGYVTTLGRGGSDLSALAMATALKAEEVVIYTDVPGIAYADPRIVPGAEFIHSLPVSQLYWLSQGGAKVMHARAVKTAMDHNISFYVRATGADGEGTFVDANSDTPFLPFAGIASVKSGEEFSLVSVVLHPGSEDKVRILKKYWSQRPENPEVEYISEQCCLRCKLKKDQTTCFIQATYGILTEENLNNSIKDKVHD